jgi:RNA polymerase sigma-70 factor (ECF subfamily)
LPADNPNLRFEQVVLPHLDAAFNLARWLTASDHDAQDVTQEACLRALKFVESHHGTNPRAWLLAIVRNTCFTWLKKNRPRDLVGPLLADDLMDQGTAELNPEVLAIRNADCELVRQAIAVLPAEYREIVVLREMEGLSYKEIGEIAGVPLGTVMSRLSRARAQLEQGLAKSLGEVPHKEGSARGL